MTISRLEINVRRLLKKTENLAKQNENEDIWRLQKYVESLQSFVDELHFADIKPSKDDLDRYKRRIEYLKGLLETKKMQDTVEKAMITKMLPTLPPEEDIELNQMRHKLVAQSEMDLREELFQLSNTDEGLRKRGAINVFSHEQNHEGMMDLHKLKQEEASQDMLTIMRNMREQSELAGKIIREDTKLLEKSSYNMTKTYSSLQKESNRLDNLIAKSGWNCWMWILVVMVIVIFINMVIFMKFTKKKYNPV